jgi:death-on-curing protein
MIKFEREQVLLLQRTIIERTGGSDGVRDYNLLDSAINSAYQTFGGNDLYATVLEKGARLGYSLVSNHAFVDGNKRIGVLVMLTFLKINGVKLSLTDLDVIDIGLSLADGSMDYEKLVKRLEKHCV